MGLVSIERAFELAEKLRKEGKKIVLANGVFDLLHKGHILYLQEAKALGDVLFVAVNSDLSVRKLKGEARPILPQEERAFIVASLSAVDYAFVFEEEDVGEIIRRMRPHFHAKGGDYTPETVPERDVAQQVGTITVITGGAKISSTTDIIGKILERFCR